MGGTAQDLSQALAEATGKPFPTIKAYCTALSNHGWWEKPKRGVGAKPKTDMDAAKLLLALLATGPKDLPGYFLKYANLRVPPQYQSPLYAAMSRCLDVAPEKGFLDFIGGLVKLFRTGQASALIQHNPSEPGQADDFVYDGPNVDVSVQGPYPIGIITFTPSEYLLRTDVEPGGDARVGGDKAVEIGFLDLHYAAREESLLKGQPTLGMDSYLQWLREETARGIKFKRWLGGRELSAVANAMREPPDLPIHLSQGGAS